MFSGELVGVPRMLRETFLFRRSTPRTTAPTSSPPEHRRKGFDLLA